MGFINKRLRSIVNCDLIPPTCHEISNSIDHFLCNQSYYFPQLASRNAVVTWWMLCASQLFWYRDWWCQGLWHSSWILMSRLFGFQLDATKSQNTYQTFLWFYVFDFHNNTENSFKNDEVKVLFLAF